MSEVVNVTVAAPDADWLRSITHRLVDEGLVAAGNITEHATSIYLWQGEIREADEAIASLRSQRQHVAAIVEIVKAEHPYEIPHVVATPVVEANPEYEAWIIRVTGGPEGDA